LRSKDGRFRGNACIKLAYWFHSKWRSHAASEHSCMLLLSFLAGDVIYTSRAYAMMPVRLSVTEVHWRIIANLGFKFRSHFTAHGGGLAASAAVLCCLQHGRSPCYLRADYLAPC